MTATLEDFICLTYKVLPPNKPLLPPFDKRLVGAEQFAKIVEILEPARHDVELVIGSGRKWECEAAEFLVPVDLHARALVYAETLRST